MARPVEAAVAVAAATAVKMAVVAGISDR